MKIKKVYLHPGDLVRLVVVHPAFERSAAGAKEQMRPSSILLKVNSHDSISAADPMVRLDNWNET